MDVQQESTPDPDVKFGIDYWTQQPASLDGVLGGFGTGSLPRVDALGSRQFLLYLRPDLCTVPSAIRPLSSARLLEEQDEEKQDQGKGTPGPLSASLGSSRVGKQPQTGKEGRVRALDVGAGIGRVTSTVLLHLVDDVVLLEPVEPFIQRAIALGRASETDEEDAGHTPATSKSHDTPAVFGSTAWRGEATMGTEVSEQVEAEGDDDDENKAREEADEPKQPKWKGIKNKTKSVTFIQATLQDFDPLHPPQALARVGYTPSVTQSLLSAQEKQAATSSISENTSTKRHGVLNEGEEVGFDVIWCQWCLGHLSDVDLVSFLERSRSALRNDSFQGGVAGAGRPLIVVKENVCTEPEGVPLTVFDAEDSSLTRGDLAWKKIFEAAGLKIVREQVQEGFPEGIYTVKMYALR